MSAVIYVGLSGGVDSSVTAALLRQQGYRVVGVYMQNWTQPVAGLPCPWKQDLADAKAVAATLGIPFKVFDFQQQYKQLVVDYMVAAYRAGLTPNPDVMCNQEIKFKLFLDAALADGADLIASGHYARVQDGQLLAGIDGAKDQSYFLYRVSAAALCRTLMPLGELTKPQVRQLAREFGLPTAAKPDSVGICFVGQVGIKEFLQQYLPAGVTNAQPGPVRTLDGQLVGQHEGAIFYTIGQRRGLGTGGGQQYYVVGKDMKMNALYVSGRPADLENQTEITLDNLHWINQVPAEGEYSARLRYRGELIPARLRGSQLQLEWPERAVTPGQSAVIYDGERVVGGGIIAAHQPAPVEFVNNHY